MQNYTDELEKLKNNSTFRTIKNIQKKEGKYIFVDNKKLLNLSSNDYLNISTNIELKNEFIEKYKHHPEFLFSSASARLLTGTSDCYKKLENNISKLFQKESALIFNTGYQCNQGVISSLFFKNDVILSDKLNHNSIISGLKLTSAEHIRYKHLDYNNLEFLLKKHRNNYNNAAIITESIFSMDGDIADIKKLVELKKKYNCMLMLDEAHAFGVFGDNLTGVAENYNLLNEIDIITVTLGKSLGSMGAVCLSSKSIIDYLINKAAPFIFSTAIPSVNVLWSNFLLEEKFDYLIKQKQKLNDLFNKIHKIYPTNSSSQIIPIIIGSAEDTTCYAKNLRQEGFYTLPINPPTVPIGASRIRISLTANIKYDEIKEVFLCNTCG